MHTEMMASTGKRKMGDFSTQIKYGVHFLLASGSADATRKVDPQELWPYAILFDKNDGDSLLAAHHHAAKSAATDGIKIEHCSFCEDKASYMNDTYFSEGLFLSLEAYDGKVDWIDDLECLTFYMCPTCLDFSKADPIRSLIDKLLGDFDGLRYVKID